MHAWLSARSLSPVLPGFVRGFAAVALTAGCVVAVGTAAAAAPRLMQAALSAPGAPAVNGRCDGADLQALRGPLLAGRLATADGDAAQQHGQARRQPTLNRAAPGNEDLRRFSRAF